MAKKKSKLKVDFSEVTSFSIPEEGNYLVKVGSASMEQGQKGPYISWTFEITAGEHKGSKIFHNTSLSPQSLFSLKGLLEALGINVPKGELDLDLSSYEGLTAEVVLSPEVYEGKKRARIVEFIPSGGSDDDIEGALEDLDLAELKAVAKELKIKTTKKDDEDSVIEKILDAIDEEEIEEDEVFEAIDELFGDDEDEEDEEDDEDDEDEMDYESMSLKELKSEAKSRGLKVKGLDKDDLVEMLEEDDEE